MSLVPTILAFGLALGAILVWRLALRGAGDEGRELERADLQRPQEELYERLRAARAADEREEVAEFEHQAAINLRDLEPWEIHRRRRRRRSRPRPTPPARRPPRSDGLPMTCRRASATPSRCSPPDRMDREAQIDRHLGGITMARKFDAIVIGTGQAGPSLAVRLATAGMRVGVVERKSFGGTCVNTGCMPTKALVASARAAFVARRASDWGVTIDGPVGVDMAKVKARKDEIVRSSSQGVEQWLKDTANCTVFEGHARLEEPYAVRVGGELLEAERIFLNVGARAFVPPVPGVDVVPYFTNSTMMDVDFVPEHLIVIGGSYVGLEFAQMYRRFGSEVTIVERGPRLIAREDDEVSVTIGEVLEGEGVTVRRNAECIGVGRRGDEVVVRLECATGSREVVGSHLLLAVGRRPNTDDLGLEAAGIETDERGHVIVDDELRTTVPGVWALGDCNGKGAFTHTSYNDYEIVVANLLDGDPRRVSDRIPAYGLFVDPPLGRVGMTEAEARRSGRRVLVGRRPMTRIGRAIEKGETQGFMKVLVDADSREILGAAILGVEGDEAVHSLLDMMYARAPYTVIQRAVHIHPTVSELVPTMLGELRPLE